MKRSFAYCRRCGANEYTTISIGKKYYKICDRCQKKIRFYPKRAAYGLYNELCEYEASLATWHLLQSREYIHAFYTKLKVYKKKYRYVYHNLLIFVECYYANNYHKSFKQSFTTVDIIKIIKEYKAPIDQEQCLEIANKLDELATQSEKPTDDTLQS
jgi:hypothetical protein